MFKRMDSLWLRNPRHINGLSSPQCWWLEVPKLVPKVLVQGFPVKEFLWALKVIRGALLSCTVFDCLGNPVNERVYSSDSRPIWSYLHVYFSLPRYAAKLFGSEPETWSHSDGPSWSQLDSLQSSLSEAMWNSTVRLKSHTTSSICFIRLYITHLNAHRTFVLFLLLKRLKSGFWNSYIVFASFCDYSAGLPIIDSPAWSVCVVFELDKA